MKLVMRRMRHAGIKTSQGSWIDNGKCKADYQIRFTNDKQSIAVELDEWCAIELIEQLKIAVRELVKGKRKQAAITESRLGKALDLTQ